MNTLKFYNSSENKVESQEAVKMAGRCTCCCIDFLE
ncbi:hypothetical protein ALT761_00308 [Alteromonas sp. 76-1]|nr:hypothetical protein ALT761_00308 [Alteromonas sp. 76-1]